jgi:hypothetical protein
MCMICNVTGDRVTDTNECFRAGCKDSVGRTGLTTDLSALEQAEPGIKLSVCLPVDQGAAHTVKEASMPFVQCQIRALTLL